MDIEQSKACARRWRQAAAEASGEDYRQVCIDIAEGYELLAQIMLSSIDQRSLVQVN